VAINPDIVRGQLLGAAVHGVGGALFEQLDHGDGGEPLTGGLRDYHVPLANDLPNVKAVVLELAPSPRNPLGVRGVGEIATAGAAAAIANAVADAVAGRGIPVTALPLLPERLAPPSA
jgi:carbon-monoxide dehydrogenase large subunit